jgi:hypothetical protein
VRSEARARGRASLFGGSAQDGVDYAKVRGQEHAKRALEVAVAGAHNLFMLYRQDPHTRLPESAGTEGRPARGQCRDGLTLRPRRLSTSTQARTPGAPGGNPQPRPTRLPAQVIASES